MLLTRIPPTVAELVARAIASTPFVAEATGDNPHDMRICAELCAELAAEQWEREHGASAGELHTEVADALVAHASALRDANDNALYQAHAKLERSMALLAGARNSIKGVLPLAAAERLMDNVETHFDHIRVALTRAAGVFESAIDRIEWAASKRRPKAV
jgi:4-hydroxyphenylpyruvate dioxygenase-like putative hemolysin